VQRGMDITIVTTASTDEAGTALLDAFGFPFQKGGVDDSGLPPVKRSSRGPVRRGRSAKK
jgi:large subunit ribosomal protein L5